MIENRVANKLFPDVWLEGEVTWLMPIASELETSVRPVSLALPSTKTALPGLVLASGNNNGSVKSNELFSQRLRLLAATNAGTLPPWLMPYCTIGIYMNGVATNFVDITSLKQTEEKLRQNQEQLESLNKDLAELVAERTEQVRRLASEMLIAEQKVQQAIAHLLHDDLQQLLFSIKIKAEELRQFLSVDEQLLQDQIQEFYETVDLAFTVTRELAVDLRPPFFLNQNFMESLNWVARLMKKRYGLTVRLKGTLRPDWLKDKEEVHGFLLQAVRELLFNVVKHAGVSQAQVEVTEESDRSRITVSDDGQGFDAATTMQLRNSLGLFNIRSRVELFGGQFQIESQLGQGTRVTIMTLM